MSDELKQGEPHPSALSALRWFNQHVGHDPTELFKWTGLLASVAIGDNKLAQVCVGTLNRLMKGEPVGDRYLLGLCWLLRDLKEKNNG
ncbi:hypothetical protein LCGC14_2843940 [marine sediment metagenome]|uniref:Uncharacterized protein n=1 Tax=marine sediment metagenome TaxID=412755 RepID=A0A0F8YX50_9ZZZZ